MKALLKTAAGNDKVILTDIDEPVLNDNELKVKVEATGICGTDLHIIKDEYPANYPVVMGHEYSGTVVDKGGSVSLFKEGDRVVSLTAKVTCGDCEYCRKNLLMLCENRLSIGSGVDGSFAEYVTIPESLAYPIPEGLSFEEAALSEPLACVVRCVIERGQVQPENHVLITGPGTIGLLTLLVVKAIGATVTMLGTSNDTDRLELAKQLGADTCILLDEEGDKSLKEVGPIDVACECSGAAPAARTCLDLLKKTGKYIQIGLFGKPIAFDLDQALMKEIMITNGFASEPSSWEIALDLLGKKKLSLTPLISTILPIEQWRAGFELVENKQAYKVLFKFESSI